MPRFTKKPLVVDAVCFNGSSTHASRILNWINGGEEPEEGGIHTCDITTLEIPTLEGVMTASPGDWIIKGIEGEFYPCKPETFKKTYNPA